MLSSRVGPITDIVLKGFLPRRLRLSHSVSDSNVRYVANRVGSVASFRLFDMGLFQDKPSHRRSFSSEKSETIMDDHIISSKDLRRKLKEHIGARSNWLDNKQFQENAAKRVLVSSQDELEVRHIRHSVQEVLIPLGKDMAVRDKYLTFFKTVRVGMLLEDMDTLAGWVGFKFFRGPGNDVSSTPGFGLVTACVDKFDVSEDIIQADKDIKLTGFVSWAGRTSLEITIVIDQEDAIGWKKLATATFVMVARDPQQGHSVLLNKLEPESEDEKLIIESGERRKQSRKEKADQSLFKVSPIADEREVIHQLFLKTLSPTRSTFQSRVKPENTIWMEQTRLKNLLICHPQARNMYNKIFGGFLMREAFELAWANTCVCIKSRPTIICMDDINFKKPVEVGSLLYLSSQIVYSQENYLQTRVHAEVVQPKTGHIDTTNVFHFHFTSAKEFPQVMPSTYGEYMLYLDGRRHCVVPLIDPLHNLFKEQ